MKLREFMDTYSRYGKVDIPNICEQCNTLNREYISNERKEENKMEQDIKIIIRKDYECNSKTYSKYILELVNQQDKMIFEDYFILDNNNVIVSLTDPVATILDTYSFDDYIELLKSYGIVHKIEKMLSEEEIRRVYNIVKSNNVRDDMFYEGYLLALEYVLGIDNE